MKNYLSRHNTPHGPRWAFEGQRLPESFSLALLLELSRDKGLELLRALTSEAVVTGEPLAPLEAQQEVWASGVTYLRSREARKAESDVADVYERVYEAERPELFFKALGWRVVGEGAKVRIREDSRWNVPEPELVLVVNAAGEVIGYSAGNDMSSRDIEGENPLYLPQAKIYNGSCAVGPGIKLATLEELQDLPITLEIGRGGETVFSGETSTAQMKRKLSELVDYLVRELEFPHGVLLMTGTGIVPPEDFTLHAGDRITITVGELTLMNEVQQ